jgi:hypothetical protein
MGDLLQRFLPEHSLTHLRIQLITRKAELAVRALSNQIPFEYFQSQLAAATLTGYLFYLGQHSLADPQASVLADDHDIMNVDQRSTLKG